MAGMPRLTPIFEAFVPLKKFHLATTNQSLSSLEVKGYQGRFTLAMRYKAHSRSMTANNQSNFVHAAYQMGLRSHLSGAHCLRCTGLQKLLQTMAKVTPHYRTNTV